MIGTEEERNEEETVLKVTDRRKFNSDGSLRDGVTIEKEPEEKVPEPTPIIDSATEEPTLKATPEVKEERPKPDFDEEKESQNPASFVNFLSTLVTNAAAALGAMPHPVTGQKTVDLETGKYWIDVMTMIREKTKGNLAEKEEDLLQNILSDLQMQYVALNKAAEEKLKAQAAEKFSSKDILGG